VGFHGFWQAKLAYGGSTLDLFQFTLLSQLPQKMILASKVVKKRPKNNQLTLLSVTPLDLYPENHWLKTSSNHKRSTSSIFDG
jgi:hypothetical protein